MRARRLRIVVPVAIVALLALFALVGALVRDDDRHATTETTTGPSLSLTGPGAINGTTGDAAPGDGTATRTAEGAAPEPASDQSSDSAATGDQATATGDGRVSYADVPPASTASAHYLVRNGALTLTVKRHGLRDAMQRIDAITLGMGGYVLSSSMGSQTAWYRPVAPLARDASGAAMSSDENAASQPRSSGSSSASGDANASGPSDGDGVSGSDDGSDVVQYGTMTVRVPEARFDAAVERFSKLGEVVDLTTSADDVSDQMVDLRARLRHQKAVERRLLGFLAQTKNIRETLAVQDRIDEAQLAIERLSAEITQLSEVTSYGTITVTMRERGAPQSGTIDESDTFWGAFINSLRLIGDGAAATAVALGALLPFLVLFGAIGAAVWYGRRAILRHRPPRALQEPEAPQTPAAQG